MRQRNFHYFASRGGEFLNGGFDGAAHLGIESFAEIFFRHPQLQSANRAFDFIGVVRHWHVGGCRIQRIASGNVLQQQRGIFHGFGERADVVERRGKSDQPVARDATISRREANHTAKCRRLSDGAAGVGAQRRHRGSGSDHGG